MARVLALLILAAAPALALAQAAPALPAPPQTFETPYVAPAGRIIAVNAGDDLQAALNRAQRGDTLVLAAGATFTGSFTLPHKTTGEGWIYIQTSAYANLPAPGTRVTPGHAVHMPKIVAPGANQSAIRTASRASHYRFVGIEIRPRSGDFVTNLVQIGNGESSIDLLPSHIVFDRVIVRGDPTVGGRRGIAMDGRAVAVIDSQIRDFKEQGADSQGLWAHNTPGPLKITNNHIEGAGENLLTGGADPNIPNVVPSDIEIRQNDFYKPLAWIGERWTVKNSLELKTGRRVLIEGNNFINNWSQAQVGFSVLFTPRNQNGRAPWTQISDITFVRNRILNSAQGINMLGTDDIHLSLRTERILIRDNFIELTGLRANGTAAGATDGTARVFQVNGGIADLTIDHNTSIIRSGANRVIMMAVGEPKTERFSFTNNIADKGDYGFFGGGTSEGLGALGMYFSNWRFARNAIVGASARWYPPDNFFPADHTAVGFQDALKRDFRLAERSSLRGKATDGTDLGARFDVARLDGQTSASARPRAPQGVAVQ